MSKFMTPQFNQQFDFNAPVRYSRSFAAVQGVRTQADQMMRNITTNMQTAIATGRLYMTKTLPAQAKKLQGNLYSWGNAVWRFVKQIPGAIRGAAKTAFSYLWKFVRWLNKAVGSTVSKVYKGVKQGAKAYRQGMHQLADDIIPPAKQKTGQPIRNRIRSKTRGAKVAIAEKAYASVVPVVAYGITDFAVKGFGFINEGKRNKKDEV